MRGGRKIAASAVPVLRDARPAASLLRTRAERRLRKIESKRTPPHGEEGRAATRLEPCAAGARSRLRPSPSFETRGLRPRSSGRGRSEDRGTSNRNGLLLMVRSVAQRRVSNHGPRAQASRLRPPPSFETRGLRPRSSGRGRSEDRGTSKRTPAHGEERRAATRLEPWAAGASIAASAVPVLRDARPAASLLRTRAERRLRNIESK